MEEIKENGKYLPIGSVVLLKGGTKRVMITGFCSIPKGESRIYDYTGCMYPEGILSSSSSFLFNHEQIEKLFFIGFKDEEETEFKEKLNDMMQKINTVTEKEDKKEVEVLKE